MKYFATRNVKYLPCGKYEGKKRKKREFLPLLIFFIGQSDKIVCAYAVKAAKRYKVVYFQLGASVLDVAVALLGFVQYCADLLLRKVVILP
jgi:hypothetical protein